MAIYPICKHGKEGTFLSCSHSFMSKEAAERTHSLYMEDLVFQDKDGKVRRRYRLNAAKPHTIEDYLAYDITCPACGGRLKLVGRALNSHELGLYACPACDKR